jgi:hypothetical protein
LKIQLSRYYADQTYSQNFSNITTLPRAVNNYAPFQQAGAIPAQKNLPTWTQNGFNPQKMVMVGIAAIRSRNIVTPRGLDYGEGVLHLFHPRASSGAPADGQNWIRPSTLSVF